MGKIDWFLILGLLFRGVVRGLGLMILLLLRFENKVVVL